MIRVSEKDNVTLREVAEDLVNRAKGTSRDEALE